MSEEEKPAEEKPVEEQPKEEKPSEESSAGEQGTDESKKEESEEKKEDKPAGDSVDKPHLEATAHRLQEFKTFLDSIIFDRKLYEEPLSIPKEVKDYATRLLGSKPLSELAPQYPEFDEVKTSLKELVAGKKGMLAIERYLLSVVDITNDSHLMSVTKSNEDFIHFYNEMVELYSWYEEQMGQKDEAEEALVKKEADYMKKVQDFSQEKPMMEAIKSNSSLASSYNDLIDLYNHYTKRKELHNSLMQAAKTEGKG